MSVVERNRNNINKRWNTKSTKNTTSKSGIPEDTKNTDNDNDLKEIDKEKSTRFVLINGRGKIQESYKKVFIHNCRYCRII